MSETTIEWTKRPGTIGETLNPTTGCNKVDRGCKNCYAEIMHRRLQAMGQAKYAQDFLKGAVPHWDVLSIPYTWKKPRTVFVNSMSDLFHKDVPFEFIRAFFETMFVCYTHTFLILTKRPDRALEFWNWAKENTPKHTPTWECPPNVWMGTSANDQESGQLRIPQLMKLSGCLRFLSYEPATGPLDLTNRGLKNAYSFPTGTETSGHGIEWTDPGDAFVGLDWVIAGGESGPKAVASNPDWFRAVRDACVQSNVPFFFKQWGLWHPISTVNMTSGKTYNVTRYPNGREAMVKMADKSFNLLDGKVWQQYPNPRT